MSQGRGTTSDGLLGRETDCVTLFHLGSVSLGISRFLSEVPILLK